MLSVLSFLSGNDVISEEVLAMTDPWLAVGVMAAVMVGWRPGT